jgi:hypothetical protein
MVSLICAVRIQVAQKEAIAEAQEATAAAEARAERGTQRRCVSAEWRRPPTHTHIHAHSAAATTEMIMLCWCPQLLSVVVAPPAEHRAHSPGRDNLGGGRAG